MKTVRMTGEQIKRDNGSGYNLAGAFPGRRFHNSTVYLVRFNGVQLDRSTVVSITRDRRKTMLTRQDEIRQSQLMSDLRDAVLALRLEMDQRSEYYGPRLVRVRELIRAAGVEPHKSVSNLVAQGEHILSEYTKTLTDERTASDTDGLA
jgi:hypothetical protein